VGEGVGTAVGRIVVGAGEGAADGSGSEMTGVVSEGTGVGLADVGEGVGKAVGRAVVGADVGSAVGASVGISWLGGTTRATLGKSALSEPSTWAALPYGSTRLATLVPAV